MNTDQPLYHAYPLAKSLHINVVDFLYPDADTLRKRHEEHVDEDRSIIVDYQFTTEYPPQTFRTENEFNMDWMQVDQTPLAPREMALESAAAETHSDVGFVVQKDHDRSVYLIPQLVLLFPLKYHFIESVKLIPSLLNYLKHVHKIESFSNFLNDQLAIQFNREQLVEAFTAKCMCTFFNYDILETYGDAFLKCFLCFSVSANRFYAHVYLVLYSGLSMLEHINLRKASLVRNVNLAAIGKRYHIPDIIIMRSATNYLGYKEPPYSPSALRVVLE